MATNTTGYGATPPVATVRARTSAPSQIATLLAIGAPPVGVLSAMGVLWGVSFHAIDLALVVGLYIVCGLGITVGFHRFFTHRAFDAGTGTKIALGILGSMGMQGPLTQWVTDHRKHHALSDREGDPHSPHIGHGDGPLAPLRGLVYAHLGWLFARKGMVRSREWARDVYDDRLLRAIDRLYLVWVALSFASPYAVGYLVGGTVAAGVEALVWGGLVRIFLFQHAGFSVNSICHMFGRQPYRSRDESRINALLGVLVLGEGWHNNHHAFPSSAPHGLDPGQIDVSWWVIRGLERLGLVWNVRCPSEGQRARRREPPPERSRRPAGPA